MLVRQLIENLPDLSTWGCYLERSESPEQPSVLVIHDNQSVSVKSVPSLSMGFIVPVSSVPRSMLRIGCYRVTINKKNRKHGIKIVGWITKTSNVTVKILPEWNDDSVISMIIACLYQETVANALLNHKILNIGGALNLKRVHQKLCKCLAHNRKIDAPAIDYPPIITSCLDLLRQRVLDFEKDDMTSVLTDMRGKYKYLSCKGVDEELILTTFREGLVEDVLSS